VRNFIRVPDTLEPQDQVKHVRSYFHNDELFSRYATAF
jgi:hypothetical protein